MDKLMNKFKKTVNLSRAFVNLGIGNLNINF
jgi:hypothetical protein